MRELRAKLETPGTARFRGFFMPGYLWPVFTASHGSNSVTPGRKPILPGVFFFSTEKPPLPSPVTARNYIEFFFISCSQRLGRELLRRFNTSLVFATYTGKQHAFKDIGAATEFCLQYFAPFADHDTICALMNDSGWTKELFANEIAKFTDLILGSI